MDAVRKTLYEKLDRFWAETEPGAFNIAYSGGLDSTAVAYIFGRKYTGGIYLYTMHHNYGNLWPQLSERHARDLGRIFGEERVHHVIVNQTDVFNEITGRSLIKDWKPYGGHAIWCLGCHLGMLTNIVVRCLEHSIPRTAICSSVGGEYAVMSMPVTRQSMSDIYWRYGIEYRAPLLEMGIDKLAERALLKDLGMWIGYRFRRGVHGVQPICIPCFQHLGDVFFDWHTTYDESNVGRYIKDKAVVIDGIVRRKIAEKGLDFDALVAANRAQHTRTEPYPHPRAC